MDYRQGLIEGLSIAIRLAAGRARHLAGTIEGELRARREALLDLPDGTI